MKPPMILAVTSVLSITCVVARASAKPDTRHLEPNAPRSVTVSEAQAPPVIRAGLLQSTLILLPDQEKVATVFGGDTVDWVFDAGHVASRFISVKPKLASVTTDIHIVSDHGNEYTLQLQEISGDADNHFDSKIFLLLGDKAAQDRLVAMPVFVPAAELERAKQDAAVAKAAAVRRAQGRRSQSRSLSEPISGQPPLRLHLGRQKGEGVGSAADLAR